MENAKQTKFLPNPQKVWEISYAVGRCKMLVSKREGLDLIPLRKKVNSKNKTEEGWRLLRESMREVDCV